MTTLLSGLPKTLVEHRTAVTGEQAQVCRYDTYLPEDAVRFSVSELTVCAMLTGTKVMHHGDSAQARVFQPGESFVLAGGESVKIDFPDARLAQPTQCLTVEIAREKVQQVAQQLCMQDVTHAYASEYLPATLHTANAPQTQALIAKMSLIFDEHVRDQMLMADLTVTELVLRLLRQNTAQFVLRHSQAQPDANGVNAAIALIRENITQSIEIEALCKAACMSRTNLYQKFKQLLDCTPAEFIINTKLDAATRLFAEGRTITDVSYTLGFRHPSHFTRRFKQKFGVSPRQYVQATSVGERLR
ncbi:AraC family transcriptional regulator [Photobacterium japonica]|uniref:AraC family transcriptional regulator n=1 Tax=Photobacterium japonica TaxID=2910235 RepID=UPI003D0CBBC5